MTVAYRTAAINPFSSTVNPAVTPPGTAQTGDLEIIYGYTEGGGSGAWTAPAGWTTVLVRSGALDGRTATIQMAYRFRPSGASGSITLNTSGNSVTGIIGYVAYSGVTPVAHAEAFVTAPSVTASSDGLAVRLFAGMTPTSSGTFSAPTTNTRLGPTSQYDGTNYMQFLVGDSAISSGAGSGAMSVTVASGGSVYGAVTIVIGGNRPPNTAAWSSPADAAKVDRTVDQVLTYTATDPDPGDSQSKRKWRYSSDGGTTWTETTETTVSQSITITGGTLAAGDYQFQVEIADQSGTWAASWSPSLHLTFADAPSAPTIISPTSGGTVAATNPLAWSFPDQVEYDVRKVADNAGTADPSTIYYGPGPVTDSVTRDLTMVNDTNGRWEHQQVRCMDSTGLWSPWADSRVDVTFDPPPTPTFTLTPVVDPFADPPKAAIVVTVATAAPGTGEVAATSVTVEARPVGATADEWSRSGQPINGDIDFENPTSGVEYEFRVTAVGDNGATADTGWAS